MKKEISDVIDLLRSNNFDKALQIANVFIKGSKQYRSK